MTGDVKAYSMSTHADFIDELSTRRTLLLIVASMSYWMRTRVVSATRLITVWWSCTTCHRRIQFGFTTCAVNFMEC